MSVFKNLNGTTVDEFYVGKKKQLGLRGINGEAEYKDILNGVWKTFASLADGIMKNGIDTGELLTIPANHHKIVQDNFYVDGELIVDGDLVIV